MTPVEKGRLNVGDEDVHDDSACGDSDTFSPQCWRLAPDAKLTAAMAVVDLAIDLAAAIDRAREDGTLSPLGCVALYLRFQEGLTLDAIAEIMLVSPRQADRLISAALEAIKGTGLLEGYEP